MVLRAVLLRALELLTQGAQQSRRSLPSGHYQKLLWLMLFLSSCFPPLLAGLARTKPASAE